MRSLAKMFVAYRRAKLELTTRPGNLLPYAKYESHLQRNLQRLRNKLRDSRWFDEIRIGEVGVWPKKVSVERGRTVRVGTHQSPKVGEADIRIVLCPSVEFGVAEAIWVDKFGPALDCLLSSSCMGYRLQLESDSGTVRESSRFLFQHWPTAYQGFQQGALSAARQYLANGTQCTIASFDFASYYDGIDPGFLLSDVFVNRLVRAADRKRVRFDAGEYLRATDSLLGAFRRFRSQVGIATGLRPECDLGRGIPIGSLISCLVANVALAPLDRWMSRRTSYVSRYVDDIILVSGDPDLHQLDANDIAHHLLPTRRSESDEQIRVSEKRLGRHGSSFTLQRSKLKVFLLRGDEGIEHLDAIGADLRSVQSERRVFLGTEDTAARTGSLLTEDGAKLTTLRDADVLRLERLSASVELMKVERLLPMLCRAARRDFLKERLSLLAKSANEIVGWVRFLDFFRRLLGVCISGGDAASAQVLVRAFRRHSKLLCAPAVRLSWSRKDVSNDEIRRLLRVTLQNMVADVVASSLSDDPPRSILGTLYDDEAVPESQWRRWAVLLGLSDLRARSPRDDRVLNPELFRDIDQERRRSGRWFVEPAQRAVLKDFRSLCERAGDHTYEHLSDMALLLARRPPSYLDLVLLTLGAGEPPSEVHSYCNVLRQTRYTGPTQRPAPDNSYNWLVTPIGRTKVADPRLILANLSTSRDAYACALKGPTDPHADRDRVTGLTNVLDEIVRHADPQIRPNLVVLPELSIPQTWKHTIGSYLLSNGVAVAMGLEYAHPRPNEVVNEVVALVPSGSSTVAGGVWSKRYPAAREGKKILGAAKRLVPRPPPFDGGGCLVSCFGNLSCLICSELIEVTQVARLFGRADIVAVPAWNTDTQSFDHLLRSASLSLHAFVGVANNNAFSDCRIRSPRKKPWAREEARLISRKRNGVISAVLELESLRAFQAGTPLKRQENANDTKPDWKPLPPGYPTVPWG